MKLWAQRSSPELRQIFSIQFFFEYAPSSATSLLSVHEERYGREEKHTLSDNTLPKTVFPTSVGFEIASVGILV